MRIAFSPPDIIDAEIEAVAEVLRSGWITTGPKTKAFEDAIAAFVGTGKAACFSSATAALECALRLLGIGPGDEVITSAYTYTATASVVYHVGATPVLLDTAEGSFEMDYSRLASVVTARTKAVIPVDIGGRMCDYDRLISVLEERKELFKPRAGTLQEFFDRPLLLADAAHSFGATYKGQPSGIVADFTAFSFHAVKNVTAAEGGALVWRLSERVNGRANARFNERLNQRVNGRANARFNERENECLNQRLNQRVDDEEIYRRLMLLSLHGQSKDALAKLAPGAWEYDILEPAWKCNMTDVAAAIGLVQLERYPELLKRRRELLALYHDELSSVGLINAGAESRLELMEHTTPTGASSCHLLITRLVGKEQEFRNAVIASMARRGIACNVHFKPLPLFTAYRERGFDAKDFPHAIAQYSNELSLPLHTLLTDEDVRFIARSLKESYEECEQSRD